MATMREALQKAGLVPAPKAAALDAAEKQKLQAQEKRSDAIMVDRIGVDMSADKRQERWMQGAAREATKPGSRVGTKAYYDRFRK